MSVYYGSPDDPEQWNIGDRGGGTFEEVAELGEAFVAEVMRVAHRISSGPPLGPLWSEQRIVNAKADPDESQLKPSTGASPLTTATPTNSGEETIPSEIMAPVEGFNWGSPASAG